MEKLQNRTNIDISVVFPSLNEGESVRKQLDELIDALEKTEKTWEIIAIDAPTKNPSYHVYEEYAKKYPNIYGINLSYAKPAGSSKSDKYMIGFELARGKYIIQIDSDYQDNPADLPKFLEKLDEGYDLVVGNKKERKDDAFYMFGSKVANLINRNLFGIELHDTNCGFKGYKAHVAKSLNLRGRLYRWIPALLAAKGFKITEIPIKNRKRIFGKTNFKFISRLPAGLFDPILVFYLNKTGYTPFYFYCWVALAFGLFSMSSLIIGIFVGGGFWGTLWLLLFAIFMTFSGISIIIGLTFEYSRFHQRDSLSSYDIQATTSDEIRKKLRRS